jgi:hypothetical protein
MIYRLPADALQVGESSAKVTETAETFFYQRLTPERRATTSISYRCSRILSVDMFDTAHELRGAAKWSVGLACLFSKSTYLR